MKSLNKFRIQLDEGTKLSSDYYISPETGRKVRARRINFGGYEKQSDTPQTQDQINKSFYDKLAGIQQDLGKKEVERLVNKRRREENKPLKTESFSPAHTKEPPLVLVLRRKSIRMFNDGIKVALYHNDLLNKDFTVALGSSNANYQAEEFVDSNALTELLESNFVTHNDGLLSEFNDDEKVALTALYENLDEINKEKMLNCIVESSEKFDMIKRFAIDINEYN